MANIRFSCALSVGTGIMRSIAVGFEAIVGIALVAGAEAFGA
jgi:hypothetical protein